MTEYPYMMSNNKIPLIISSLQSAAKPTKFTIDFLKNLGYTSTNDRAIIPLFKKLGLLTEDSIPTIYYDHLRDKTTYKKTLAGLIRDLYSELFVINTEVNIDTDDNIKGAISRVTGGDVKTVARVFNTFKTLCSISDFSFKIKEEKIIEKKISEVNEKNIQIEQKANNDSLSFQYNIQIHLPATTDISVYNAIFKSLKENLII